MIEYRWYTNQRLHRTNGWVIDERALKERSTGKVVVLGGVVVVCGGLNVHQTADSEYHEGKRELMRNERILCSRAGTLFVKYGVDIFFKVFLTYGVVPDTSISVVFPRKCEGWHTSRHRDDNRFESDTGPLMCQGDARKSRVVGHSRYLESDVFLV